LTITSVQNYEFALLKQFYILNDDLKKEIKHIVVEEFKGIDNVSLY